MSDAAYLYVVVGFVAAATIVTISLLLRIDAALTELRRLRAESLRHRLDMEHWQRTTADRA